MNTNKKFVSLVLALVISISAIFGLVSCGEPEPDPKPKDIIIENVNNAESNNTRSFDYFADFLITWGFPAFDREKVAWAEKLFVDQFVLNGGMSNEKSAVLPRAISVARIFLDNYYDNINLNDSNAVTEAIINSLIDLSGDKYSTYRPLEATDEHDENMSGTFGGIGVVVEYNDENCTVMVIEVVLGSPAEAAGIHVGDFFHAVDGHLISDIGHRDAIKYIRGEIGTEVSLVMLRGDQLINVVATRAQIVERTVGYGITEEENYGYIQITSFKGNTDEQFIAAVDDLMSRGVGGLIIDLRNNLGGYVATAINMLSYILPSGLFAIKYDFKTSPDRIITTSDDTTSTGEKKDSVIDLPIVILCNEYSASSSEIFISVLMDYEKEGLVNLTTVGTITYKKGIIQQEATYKDLSTITLTTAYYYPPSGTLIHGVGITPDVVIYNSETEDLQLLQAVEEMAKLCGSVQ